MFQQKYTILQGIFILLKYFKFGSSTWLSDELEYIFKIEIVIKVIRVPLSSTLQF